MPAVLVFISTLAGGYISLHFKEQLDLIKAFSAGALIATALFDLFPEAIRLSDTPESNSFTLGLVGVGFMGYMVLSGLISGKEQGSSFQKIHGGLAAGSVSVHSFFDSVSIGLLYGLPFSVGILPALSIILHNFCDGVSIISITQENGGKTVSLRWLLIDAITPVLGIIFSCFFNLSGDASAIITAILSGMFLFIGASDLLPESRQGSHPGWATITMTILAATIVYLLSFYWRF